MRRPRRPWLCRYLATWVPLLSGLVGCMLSLVTFGVAVGHACVVVAVAWVFHRPWLAAGLLTLAAICFAAIYGALRKPPPSSSSTPMSGSKGM